MARPRQRARRYQDFHLPATTFVLRYRPEIGRTAAGVVGPALLRPTGGAAPRRRHYRGGRQSLRMPSWNGMRRTSSGIASSVLSGLISDLMWPILLRSHASPFTLLILCSSAHDEVIPVVIDHHPGLQRDRTC